VGIFSLGGQAALEKPKNFDIAVPIIERSLNLGVNYIDTSSIYGGPERWSEQYVGRVMKTRRNEAFLATKTKERTRDGSLRMIERSLQLLNTDHVDLWQLHDVGLPQDVDAIFAKGGAMEALIEMHEQKVVRFLGVTGHYRPEALIDTVNRYPFDTILMSLNAADGHIHSFQDKLLPLVVEKQMGIIGMKVPARGRLLTGWTPPPVDQQQHMWEGSAVATRMGVMDMKAAMRSPIRSAPSSSAATTLPSLKKMSRSRVGLRRCHSRRWRSCTPRRSPWLSSPSSSGSPTGRKADFAKTAVRLLRQRSAASSRSAEPLRS
jgi:aryl-alcohol dehydrogenase-like predicted oxidoreductase